MDNEDKAIILREIERVEGSISESNYLIGGYKRILEGLKDCRKTKLSKLQRLERKLKCL